VIFINQGCRALILALAIGFFVNMQLRLLSQNFQHYSIRDFVAGCHCDSRINNQHSPPWAKDKEHHTTVHV